MFLAQDRVYCFTYVIISCKLRTVNIDFNLHQNSNNQSQVFQKKFIDLKTLYGSVKISSMEKFSLFKVMLDKQKN